MALSRVRFCAFVALLAAAALGASCCASAIAAGGLDAAATTLGINLGNVLEEPAERPAPHDAEERFFDAYASAGFGLVRVPVRWDGHTLATPPYTINSTWLARVAEVAGWAASRGLRVVVNSHHDDWLDVADNGAFNASHRASSPFGSRSPRTLRARRRCWRSRFSMSRTSCPWRRSTPCRRPSTR